MDRDIKYSAYKLKLRQALSLEEKVSLTNSRVRQWYEHFNGQVYVSFSGGKDSTVLLDIVRKQYPDVPAVFVDTGLEFPEIRDFIKTVDNVTWLKPKMNFKQVIGKYGYPVVSKKISMGVSRYRNTKSDLQKELRLHGGTNPTSGKKQHPTISKKWHHLINAPFKISERCCDIMKKSPIKRYNKLSGRAGIIGTMASDSDIRKQSYLKDGCNAFDRASGALSTPMAFWEEGDVWAYIKKNNLPYSNIYDKGYDRTGCVFCAFGCHMEKDPRFVRLQKTHPKLWDYCIIHLKMGPVLDYLKVPYKVDFLRRRMSDESESNL